jgi:hypothetical protein
VKEKPVKAEVPYRADAKERADDAIEPKEYEKMDDLVKDL